MTSTTALSSYHPPGLPFSNLARSTPSISDESQIVNQRTLETFQDSGYSLYKIWIYKKLNDSLVEDWDSAGAKAVSDRAISTVAAFLTQLEKESLSFPEIEADSDGWITMEWYFSSDNVMHVSVGPDGVGTFASLLQGLKDCGEFSLSEKTIDEKVLALLRRLEKIISQSGSQST